MAWADCAKCLQHFSSVSAFDRHQTIRQGRVICHEPSSRGLVLNSRSRWALPGRRPIPQTKTVGDTAP